MNISSSKYRLRSIGGGLATVEHVATRQTKTIRVADLPSAHELAMMHETRFNQIMGSLTP